MLWCTVLSSSQIHLIGLSPVFNCRGVGNVKHIDGWGLRPTRMKSLVYLLPFIWRASSVFLIGLFCYFIADNAKIAHKQFGELGFLSSLKNFNLKMTPTQYFYLYGLMWIIKCPLDLTKSWCVNRVLLIQHGLFYLTIESGF